MSMVNERVLPIYSSPDSNKLFAPEIQTEIEECMNLVIQIAGNSPITVERGQKYEPDPNHRFTHIGKVVYVDNSSFFSGNSFVMLNSNNSVGNYSYRGRGDDDKADNAARVLCICISAIVGGIACYFFGSICSRKREANEELSATEERVERALKPSEEELARCNGEQEHVAAIRRMVTLKKEIFNTIICDQNWKLALCVGFIATAALGIYGAIIASNAVIIGSVALGAITLMVGALYCGCVSNDKRFVRKAVQLAVEVGYLSGERTKKDIKSRISGRPLDMPPFRPSGPTYPSYQYPAAYATAAPYVGDNRKSAFAAVPSSSAVAAASVMSTEFGDQREGQPSASREGQPSAPPGGPSVVVMPSSGHGLSAAALASRPVTPLHPGVAMPLPSAPPFASPLPGSRAMAMPMGTPETPYVQTHPAGSPPPYDAH